MWGNGAKSEALTAHTIAATTEAPDRRYRKPIYNEICAHIQKETNPPTQKDLVTERKRGERNALLVITQAVCMQTSRDSCKPAESMAGAEASVPSTRMEPKSSTKRKPSDEVGKREPLSHAPSHKNMTKKDKPHLFEHNNGDHCDSSATCTPEQQAPWKEAQTYVNWRKRAFAWKDEKGVGARNER